MIIQKNVRWILITILNFLCFNSLFAQEDLQLLEDISKGKDNVQKVKKYEKLYLYFEKVDPKKALETTNSMLQLSKKIHYKTGVKTATNLKARHFFNQNNVDSAIYYYRSAIQLFDKHSSNKERAKIYSGMGASFNLQNNADSALYYFTKGFNRCKTGGCGEVNCALLNNMGITVFNLGNPQRSLGYFEDAYRLAIKEKYLELLPNIVNNLAAVSTATGENISKTSFIDLIEDHLLEANNEIKSTVYLNLGSLYLRNNNIELAENYLSIAYTNFQMNESMNPEMIHSLGSLYYQKKEYKKALYYFLEAMKEYPEYTQWKLLYKDIAATYFALGDYANSNRYSELTIKRLEEINSQKIDSVLSQAQKQLEFYKKDTEIKELKYKNDVKDWEKSKIWMYAVLVISLLILIVLIIWIYLVKERNKRKINELLLEQKNKRLSDLAKKIEHRNKAISEIEQKFDEYKNQQIVESQFKEDLVESLNLYNDTETYSLYFEDQHKGFYENLKKISPQLTNNDLRLCSLTKLRLSLKETAEILNLSTDAVKSGRYRLRKKLNLDPDINLSDYFNSL